MNIGQLRKVLKLEEEYLRRLGREDEAQALSKFAANLLMVSAKETVSAFITRVERARAAANKAAREPNAE